MTDDLHWLALQFKPWNGYLEADFMDRPLLFKSTNDLKGPVYWPDNDHAYFVFKSEQEARIVADYGLVKNMDRFDVMVQYKTDFAPQPSTNYFVGEGGLVSPSGDWYPCGIQGHSDLSEDLYTVFYGNFAADAEDFLRREGWVVIHEYSLVSENVQPTREQIDTISKLYQENDDKWRDAREFFLFGWKIH